MREVHKDIHIYFQLLLRSAAIKTVNINRCCFQGHTVSGNTRMMHKQTLTYWPSCSPNASVYFIRPVASQQWVLTLNLIFLNCEKCDNMVQWIKTWACFDGCCLSKENIMTFIIKKNSFLCIYITESFTLMSIWITRLILYCTIAETRDKTNMNYFSFLNEPPTLFTFQWRNLQFILVWH